MSLKQCKNSKILNAINNIFFVMFQMLKTAFVTAQRELL